MQTIDTKYILKKLKEDYDNKRLAFVEVATGLNQRTMKYLLKATAITRESTKRSLQHYYATKQEEK